MQARWLLHGGAGIFSLTKRRWLPGGRAGAANPSPCLCGCSDNEFSPSEEPVTTAPLSSVYPRSSHSS